MDHGRSYRVFKNNLNFQKARDRQVYIDHNLERPIAITIMLTMVKFPNILIPKILIVLSNVRHLANLNSHNSNIIDIQMCDYVYVLTIHLCTH